uniref:Cornifelin homolog n=1 Tax=Xiphophorus maculatus TaxID=8083 RepID=A0A3B5RF11_XIPMA
MSNPVVTNQPGAGGYGTNVQTGEWSTGLCSCFSDCLICECNQIIYLCPMHMVYKSEKYIILSVKLSQYVFSGAFGCLCPIGLSCYTANKYGENCCLGCVPGGMTAMRTHMRLTYGIQGTVCNDALMTFFCGLCELCRMAREIRIRNGDVSM